MCRLKPLLNRRRIPGQRSLNHLIGAAALSSIQFLDFFAILPGLLPGINQHIAVSFITAAG